MTISPEALEKARSLVANYGSDPDGLLVGAIAAALQAERDAAAPKLPDDLAGLVKELRDAAALKKEAADVVRPFAEHLDKMKFDRDNHGNLLPDEQAVGWVYVTNGHFRAARSFLNKLEGRE